MSDTPQGHEPDVDPGLPIDELKNLDLDPGLNFVSGVRRKINRRSLASHTIDLSVGGLTVFVKEYVSIIMESVRGPKAR